MSQRNTFNIGCFTNQESYLNKLTYINVSKLLLQEKYINLILVAQDLSFNTDRLIGIHRIHTKMPGNFSLIPVEVEVLVHVFCEFFSGLKFLHHLTMSPQESFYVCLSLWNPVSNPTSPIKQELLRVPRSVEYFTW